MYRQLLLIACFFALPMLAGAQQYQPVLPGLEGSALLQALQGNFRPAFVLPTADSRDTLFARIDARGDSLTCIYTYYTIYLDPTQDPSQDAFSKGINTEHLYPQALGASGEPARSDLHHLFPTREDVNNARGNLPFKEIPDAQTQRWYYLDQQQSTVPSSNIDLYSEWIPSGFEPPEAMKGDIARAMFYFYTMYRQEADAANASFFWEQRETFCQWHVWDPVDAREWERTWKIAAYQNNKPNPFVLDCTLPARSFCAGIVPPCDPALSSREAAAPDYGLRAFPNPFRGQARLEYRLEERSEVSMVLYDALGRQLATLFAGWQPPGTHQLDIGRELLTPGYRGLLLARLQVWDGQRWSEQVVKILGMGD
jgi:hypothetical protein